MTQSNSRISQLDLLRTIAIVPVFLAHYGIYTSIPWIKSFEVYGWPGVDIFFVISGYLISSALLKILKHYDTIHFWNFYVRRAFKIFPNYFAVLLLYCIWPAFVDRSHLPSLWRFFTFTQNIGLDFKAAGAYSHAWSICVEEHFYISLPFILYFTYRKFGTRASVILLFSTLIGGILLRQSLWMNLVATNSDKLQFKIAYFKHIFFPTYCRLDSLAAGVALGSLQQLRPKSWETLCRRANLFLAVGIVFLTAGLIVYSYTYTLSAAMYGFPLAAIGLGLITFAALSPTGLFSKVKFPLAKAGAYLAFPFYLVQKQMLHLTHTYLTRMEVKQDSGIYIFCMVVFSVLAGAALYLLVEKPCLTLRDRFFPEKKSAVLGKI